MGAGTSILLAGCGCGDRSAVRGDYINNALSRTSQAYLISASASVPASAGYLQCDVDLSWNTPNISGGYDNTTISGVWTIDPSNWTVSGTVTQTTSSGSTTLTPRPPGSSASPPFFVSGSGVVWTPAQTSGALTWTLSFTAGITGGGTVTFSNPYTAAMLMAAALAALPALPDPIPFGSSYPPDAYRYGTVFTAQIMSGAAMLTYNPSPVINNKGQCGRAEWVEHFVPMYTFDASGAVNGGGASLDSVEVIYPGRWSPAVSVSGVGSGAQLYPLMNPDGSVASVLIQNPGSDYDGSTTIAFSAPGVGATGVQATGTVTVDTDPTSATFGQILSVTITNAGNYLPKLTVSDPAYAPPVGYGRGTGATATCTMDPHGGLAAVNVTNGGSLYMAISIGFSGFPPVNGLTTKLLPHYGTETTGCADYKGVIPAGMDINVYWTYPMFYAVVDVPDEDGWTTVDFTRLVSDCSSCP